MNQTIYNKNLKALKKNYSKIYEGLAEERDDKEEIQVEVEASLNGSTVFRVRKGDKYLYLDGKYNPEQAALDWIEANKCNQYGALIILIGLGDAILLKTLLDYVDEKINVIVYEPSLEIFRRCLEEVDISSELAEKRPVFVVNDISGYKFDQVLASAICAENIITISTSVCGNYDVLFPQQVKEAVDELRYRVTNTRTNMNTDVYFSDITNENSIKNMKYLVEGCTVNALYQIVPEDYPVIVVAAGPSLDKNIDDLKAVKGRACIVACDTALKPLLAHGITPDFFLVVDARKPLELFENDAIWDIPIIACVEMPADILARHRAKKFFYESGNYFLNDVIKIGMKNREKPLPMKAAFFAIPTGGSVATSAYSFAKFLGSHHIILVGQDLALTDNRKHAEGTFLCGNGPQDENQFVGSLYEKVEGINGEELITQSNLMGYLKWYERQIKDTPDIEVIDATEGGALIHGTKVMTLKEAIKTSCHDRFDFQKAVAEADSLLDEEGKEMVYHFFAETGKNIRRTARKINHGIELYEQLKNIDANKVTIQELKNLNRRIKYNQKSIEADTIACIVMEGLKEMQFLMRLGFTQGAEDTEEAFKEIAKQGITLLKNTNQLLEEMTPLLIAELQDYGKERE